MARNKHFPWTPAARDIAIIWTHAGEHAREYAHLLPERLTTSPELNKSAVGSMLIKQRQAEKDRSYVSFHMKKLRGETKAQQDARKKKAAHEIAKRVMRVVAVGCFESLPSGQRTSPQGRMTAEAALASLRRSGPAPAPPKWGLVPRTPEAATGAPDATAPLQPAPAPEPAPTPAPTPAPEPAQWSVQFLINGKVHVAHDLSGALWVALIEQANA